MHAHHWCEWVFFLLFRASCGHQLCSTFCTDHVTDVYLFWLQGIGTSVQSLTMSLVLPCSAIFPSNTLEHFYPFQWNHLEQSRKISYNHSCRTSPLPRPVRPCQYSAKTKSHQRKRLCSGRLWEVYCHSFRWSCLHFLPVFCGQRCLGFAPVCRILSTPLPLLLPTLSMYQDALFVKVL